MQNIPNHLSFLIRAGYGSNPPEKKYEAEKAKKKIDIRTFWSMFKGVKVVPLRKKNFFEAWKKKWPLISRGGGKALVFNYSKIGSDQNIRNNNQ